MTQSFAEEQRCAEGEGFTQRALRRQRDSKREENKMKRRITRLIRRKDLTDDERER